MIGERPRDPDPKLVAALARAHRWLNAIRAGRDIAGGLLYASGSSLLLHVWDAPDTEAFIEHYKRAYERPLMEIFES